MKLTAQLCTLAQAKQLQALGVPQDSLLWLREYPCTDPDTGQPTVQVFTQLAMWDKLDAQYQAKRVPDQFYAAYSVAELGAMLAALEPRFTYWSGANQAGEWDCLESPQGHACTAATEAEARADMLLYLLQQGLASVEVLHLRSTPAQVDTIQAQYRPL